MTLCYFKSSQHIQHPPGLPVGLSYFKQKYITTSAYVKRRVQVLGIFCSCSLKSFNLVNIFKKMNKLP